MNNCDINDIRCKKSFKGKSFSNHKLSEVKSLLFQELKNGNIKEAYYWVCEIFCAGHIETIWDALVLFVGNHISIENPKLIVYFNIKLQEFNQISRTGYDNHEMLLRNNEKCREIFCEIVIILCVSPKKPNLEKIKMIKTEDFVLETLTTKLRAPSDTYIESEFESNDPLEIFIPLNEFAYSIHVSNEQKHL